MVLENGVYVNAFISATIINDSVTMRLYYKNDYKAYPFAASQPTTSADSTTAEDFSGQMMFFDKEVFGYSEFTVKDKRLFNGSTNYTDTGNITRTIKLTTNTSGGSNNLIPACVELEYEVTNCSPSALQGNLGAGSSYQECETVIVIITICSEPNGPGSGGSPGWPSAPPPNGPGGGGGGGGGSNTPGGCQVGGLIENGFAPPNPCNGPVGDNPLPPSQEQLDLLWMNNNLIDSTIDPCITSAITSLKQISPKLPGLIREFFIDTPNFKMRFNTYVSAIPSCNGNNYCQPEGAYTHPAPSNNNVYDIFINKFYWSATNLSTVATIIHEAVHAQLIQYLREAVVLQDTARQHQLAALYGYVFTPDFNYNANVYSTALQLTTQHNAMVVMYKSLVGDALYAFAQSKGIPITAPYCQKLAWAGLNNTEAFNQLSTSDKDLITEIINAERDPNGNSVNSNGSGGQIRTAFGVPCY